MSLFLKGYSASPPLSLMKISCLGPSFKRVVALGAWGPLDSHDQKPPTTTQQKWNRRPQTGKNQKVKYESNWIRTFLFWHEIKDIQSNSIIVAVFGHPYSSFWLPLKWCMDLLGSPNGFNHPPPEKKQKKTTHAQAQVEEKHLSAPPQFFCGVDFFDWIFVQKIQKKHRLLPFGGMDCPRSNPKSDPVENCRYLFDQGDPCYTPEN